MTIIANAQSYGNSSSSAAGGKSAIKLGPVKLTGLAKPVSMPIGGSQGTAVHRLPGGGRVIDVMGPDNADISWSGYLDGADASVTARVLDRLRQSGQVISLAWDIFSYQVLVTEFRCDTRHIPMPYRVTCAVVGDNSQGVVAAAVSLALDINNDLGAANLSSVSAASQAIIGNSVAAAAGAVSAPGASAAGSAAYVNLVVAANAAANAVGAAMDAADGTLLPVAASLAAGVSALDDAPLMSGQILDALSMCGDLAMLSRANGFVCRAAANLRSASA